MLRDYFFFVKESAAANTFSVWVLGETLRSIHAIFPSLIRKLSLAHIFGVKSLTPKAFTRTPSVSAISGNV